MAGVIAAAALVLASGTATRVLRGDCEGLLAALGLGAVVADLAGRRWLAFALVVATGLLRPEMLLFVVGYGAWLAWSDRRISTVAIVAGVAVVIVAAWLIPEKIGSGELLRAASRARAPVPGSPAQAAFPFLATFTNAAPVVPWVVYVGGVALVVAEVRRRRVSLPLVLAAIATALMVVVAAMTPGRRSELVALNVEDLQFNASRGLLIVIRGSKTDQERAGTRVAVPYAGSRCRARRSGRSPLPHLRRDLAAPLQELVSPELDLVEDQDPDDRVAPGERDEFPAQRFHQQAAGGDQGRQDLCPGHGDQQDRGGVGRGPQALAGAGDEQR